MNMMNVIDRRLPKFKPDESNKTTSQSNKHK